MYESDTKESHEHVLLYNRRVTNCFSELRTDWVEWELRPLFERPLLWYDSWLQGHRGSNTNNDHVEGVGRIGASLNMINTVVGGGISLIATVRYLGLF